jgi:hypothetical protein
MIVAVCIIKTLAQFVFTNKAIVVASLSIPRVQATAPASNMCAFYSPQKSSLDTISTICPLKHTTKYQEHFTNLHILCDMRHAGNRDYTIELFEHSYQHLTRIL